jgi:hypothetical protein
MSMVKVSRIFPILMLLISSGWSQSAPDLAQKYHRHVVYEVEPGVVLSARFAASGLVCEMNVEQTHFRNDVVDLRTGLEPDGIGALLDRLVPPSERGDKEDGLSGSMSATGPTMTTTDTYANVIVHVISSVETRKKIVTIAGPTVLKITWRNRPCS